MLETFINFLKGSAIDFCLNEPMSLHTTFKIGGNADILVYPKSTNELSLVLKEVKRLSLDLFVLGRGSNLLVSDSGMAGVVVSLSGLDKIEVLDNEIECEAGAHLSKVCGCALESELSGLEFAYGIPGSVGGALYMNAGAYGGEMSFVVKGAHCMSLDGDTCYLTKEQMDLGYRTSVFKTNNLIITSIILSLSKGNSEEIRAKMDELIARRKDKQPLEYPSAGSTFKRPQGNYAGTLIEQSGLKGFTVGGAQVSQKHAGFVINLGNATSKDVKTLIEKIKETVYNNSGITLETEVIAVGREENV